MVKREEPKEETAPVEGAKPETGQEPAPTPGRPTPPMEALAVPKPTTVGKPTIEAVAQAKAELKAEADDTAKAEADAKAKAKVAEERAKKPKPKTKEVILTIAGRPTVKHVPIEEGKPK